MNQILIHGVVVTPSKRQFRGAFRKHMMYYAVKGICHQEEIFLLKILLCMRRDTLHEPLFRSDVAHGELLLAYSSAQEAWPLCC